MSPGGLSLPLPQWRQMRSPLSSEPGARPPPVPPATTPGEGARAAPTEHRARHQGTRRARGGGGEDWLGRSGPLPPARRPHGAGRLPPRPSNSRRAAQRVRRPLAAGALLGGRRGMATGSPAVRPSLAAPHRGAPVPRLPPSPIGWQAFPPANRLLAWHGLPPRLWALPPQSLPLSL